MGSRVLAEHLQDPGFDPQHHQEKTEQGKSPERRTFGEMRPEVPLYGLKVSEDGRTESWRHVTSTRFLTESWRHMTSTRFQTESWRHVTGTRFLSFAPEQTGLWVRGGG